MGRNTRVVTLGLAMLCARLDAHAQVTIDGAASLLVFPRVEGGQRWDTVIELSSNASVPVYAFCSYVRDLFGSCSDINFDLTVQPRATVRWTMLRGRTDDVTDQRVP